MLDGIGSVLRAKKLEALKEIERKTIEREKELKAIENVENNIEKHKGVEKRRMEKRINRLKSVRKFMNALGGESVELITPVKKEVDNSKYDGFSKAVLGDKNSIPKKEAASGSKE